MKKGFTLTELLGVIVLIAILSGLAVVSITAVIKNGKKGLYQNYENTMEGATRNYFIDNTASLPAVNSSKNITYSQLLSGKYIDKFDDPNGGDCSSSFVIVSRGFDNGVNYSLDFKACIICIDKDGNETYSSDVSRKENYCH